MTALFRGVVYPLHKLGTKRYCWAYKVYDLQGNVYAQDNTGDLAKMHTECSRKVAALNELIDGRCDTGLRIKPPKWMNPELPVLVPLPDATA